MATSALIRVIDGSAKLGTKTRSSYRRCVERFIAFAGDDPRGWTTAVVEAWRDSLRDTRKAVTVNKHLYALRYVCKRLEATGAGIDFARAAESMPALECRREAMTLEEVRALFATCDYRPPGLRDRAAMRIAYATALRSENVQRAHFEHVKGRRLSVRQKGDRPHFPVLDDKAIQALEEWGAWLKACGVARKGPIFRQLRRDTSDQYRPGKAITSHDWFNKMLIKRAALAGVRRRIHPHLFRHTFIVMALDQGIPISRIMVQTGQSSLATLSKYVSDRHAESDPVAAYLPDVE